MQLSKKSETFCCLFISFLKSKLTFQNLEKNEPHSLSISEIIDSKIPGYLNPQEFLFVKSPLQSMY